MGRGSFLNWLRGRTTIQDPTQAIGNGNLRSAEKCMFSAHLTLIIDGIVFRANSRVRSMQVLCLSLSNVSDITQYAVLFKMLFSRRFGGDEKQDCSVSLDIPNWTKALLRREAASLRTASTAARAVFSRQRLRADCLAIWHRRSLNSQKPNVATQNPNWQYTHQRSASDAGLPTRARCR